MCQALQTENSMDSDPCPHGANILKAEIEKQNRYGTVIICAEVLSAKERNKAGRGTRSPGVRGCNFKGGQEGSF